MLHLVHVDLVVFLVCADPLDPRDALFKVDRHHQSVIVDAPPALPILVALFCTADVTERKARGS
jgi:hypothetical protein